MAYRRRQGLSRSSTFNEGIRCLPEKDDDKAATTSSAALPHISSDSRLNSFRSGGAFHSSFKYRSKVCPLHVNFLLVCKDLLI
ncbi:hypothetical protein HanOQP8_Chr11g0410071 [Helianthus annuus]|nr:hypothetical protein HanOQP8_Chr11g0410071 [Helianthus annuus]